MKRLYNTLLSFLLIFGIYGNGAACSCYWYQEEFCRAVHGGEHIILGVVLDQPEYYLMNFYIFEHISSAVPVDSLTIVGQDGINCGENLDQFAPGDTLLLAIFRNELIEGNPWFLDGFCGKHFLRYRGGSLYGQITDSVAQQSLEAFKLNLDSCIALPVNNQELNIENQALSIYPNPTQDELTVQSPGEAIRSVGIYNTEGRELLHRDAPARKEDMYIDVSHLSKGVYFMKVETDSGVRMQKIVKN